jgi:uncharacterized protein
MSRSNVATKPTSLKLDLRWLEAGQVLCREGDPPGPMYVVCSGSVRILRDDPMTRHPQLELARLGPGSVIGELAPILNTPRTATVEAAESTQILEVPLQEIGLLVRRQAGLSRVLAHALHERAGLSAEQLARVGARLGLNLPVETLGQAEAELPAGPTLPAPEHDSTAVYPKEVGCPACGARFSALVFRPHKDAPSERSSDFHQVYRSGQNPYDYELWVCPNDLYAALPADFSELAEQHRGRVAETVDAVIAAEFEGQRPEFNVDRSLALREQALKLGLGLYRMRQASPLRIASMFHRLAWCARERGDTATEQRYLSEALACYRQGYEESNGGAKEELRVQYLCAELSLRLGDVAEALRWCGQALRHTEIKQHGKWEQMLKDQWVLAREAAGSAGSAAA